MSCSSASVTTSALQPSTTERACAPEPPSIREFGYNLKTTPIVFVGGGAVVMKNFGSHDAKNISYNLDVKANARGYEQLATMGLKSARRLS